MVNLHRGVHWLIVVGIWFTVAYKPSQGGYCSVSESTEMRFAGKTIDLLIFKFTIPLWKEHKAYTCCEGYSGQQCDQISDACRQDANCRGYWCETEEPHYCASLESTEQCFLGDYTRPVRKLCDTPLKKEGCCTGFSGKTCATKEANDLLFDGEVESIKSQLIIDEGNETETYTFAGVKKFGIGHVIKKEDPEYGLPDKTPVSEKRIEEAFTADLHIAASDVTKLFRAQSKEWPSEAKEAVVNIMFNTKIDGFKRIPGMDGALMQGHWHDAATKLEDSVWYKEVKDRGARLVKTFRSLDVIPQDGAEDEDDDNFTEWSVWSQCTSTCERGDVIFDQIRTRSCKEGSICDGKIREIQPCNITKRDGNNDKDYLCECKGGTCKLSTSCTSGLTQARLCGGEANRICCLPEAQKLNCTNDWAKYYACAILEKNNNGNITLGNADGEDNTYAGALQNIKDACDGLSASRSYYKDSDCSDPGAPGGEICLTATLLKFIYDASELKSGLVVTSIAGRNHECPSYHYKGKAIDVFPPTDTSAIRDLCRNSLKGYFDDSYSTHWHCTVVKPVNLTAPDPDAPCEDINGICQESKETKCEGGYKNGLCDIRSATRKCCVWKKKEGSDVTEDKDDGDFTKWSDWSQCTSTCDRGDVIFDQIRTRSCKEGSICDGKIRETQPCNITKRDGNNDKDYLCECKGGTCKLSTLCTSGLTQARLCGGEANRICCLPEAQKLNCTNDWAKYYACAILEKNNNGNITLGNADGEDNTYAGALQNIKDACDGLSASRSYYKDSDCSDPGAPGGEICLTATLLKFIYDASELKSGLVVTSIAGRNHECPSYHYKGKAIDVFPPTGTSAIRDLCRNSLKGYFDDSYSTHWHCTVVKPVNLTAPDPDAPCEDINGICQESTETSCEGGYKDGLCDSRSATRKCCVWKRMEGSGDDSACLRLSGTCQEDRLSCTGGYQSGLCAGHASRRCCISSGGSCSNVNIVSRSQWGAQAPKAYSMMRVPVSKFFIHHTAGSSCQDITSCSSVLKGIQNDHMKSNNWSDIGYSFLVGEDGNIYEGRGWKHIGSHTKGYNSQSFAASFMGNYMTKVPGSKALEAAKNLIACGVRLDNINSNYTLFGHRDVKNTKCPGDKLYAEIQGWPHYNRTSP